MAPRVGKSALGHPPRDVGPAGHCGNGGMPPPARAVWSSPLSATSLALLAWGKLAAARGGHRSGGLPVQPHGHVTLDVRPMVPSQDL